MHLTTKLSGERFSNGTSLAPGHPGFWRRIAPSAARPLQRVLGGVSKLEYEP